LDLLQPSAKELKLRKKTKKKLKQTTCCDFVAFAGNDGCHHRCKGGRGEDIPDPPISWILLAATHEPTPRH
jgi:hypothetical protein